MGADKKADKVKASYREKIIWKGKPGIVIGRSGKFVAIRLVGSMQVLPVHPSELEYLE
jgi:hypothetical protein